MAKLRTHLREHFAALLSTAAVLLIVGHWPRFDAGHLVLIMMIFGSAGLHLLMRAKSHDSRKREPVPNQMRREAGPTAVPANRRRI